MRVLGTIGLLLVAMLAASPAWSDTFVNSLEDFEIHTASHRRRVEILGLDLYIRHNEQFPGVNPKVLLEFLRHHDEAKTEKADRLQELYRYYGKDIEKLSKAEKVQAYEVRAAINARDDEITLNFLRKKGLLINNVEPSPVAGQMLRVAHIADLVDRAESEVSPEEFGRKMRSATEFLSGKDRELAIDLEKRYRKLVQGWTYHEVRGRTAGVLQAPGACVPRQFIKRLTGTY